MTDAGTLEVTETIEHLDEEDGCTAPECGNEPKWLVFGTCLCTSKACDFHAEMQRAHLVRVAIDYPVTCHYCGKRSNAGDVKILPL